ncbi:hypothetical protein [Streptomyces sp. NRRL S-1521]|uniref:hypothetical protein n=1 Tax=Streptomyces sp. NRRL S-1521 TaxID=1609100 RepID=UPI00074A380E|nr:hypothetical protein [Streptomyces sp. NRRL S-1521]KUL54206.1 hypothetical protein ADL30_17255 [Streptomyces sp. NRRL S-1521]
MSTAQHLAVIDLLRSREFPAEHGRSECGSAGPGYHIGELLTSDTFWEDDGTRWHLTEEQYEAERDGLTVLLADRWGPPQRFSLASLFDRMTAAGFADDAAEDEVTPEPWAQLASSVPDLHLWHVEGRWIALGVAQWDKELPFQLLAVVTEIPPP